MRVWPPLSRELELTEAHVIVLTTGPVLVTYAVEDGLVVGVTVVGTTVVYPPDGDAVVRVTVSVSDPVVREIVSVADAVVRETVSVGVAAVRETVSVGV